MSWFNLLSMCSTRKGFVLQIKRYQNKLLDIRSDAVKTSTVVQVDYFGRQFHFRSTCTCLNRQVKIILIVDLHTESGHIK